MRPDKFAFGGLVRRAHLSGFCSCPLIRSAGFVLLLVSSSGCGGKVQKESAVSSPKPQQAGWIKMIGMAEAQGPLKEIYQQMQAISKAHPSPYDTPGGEIANIVRTHSLEPEAMRLAFNIIHPIEWGKKSLSDVRMEMINTVTSRANNCFY
jgi:hypothetical protein